MECRKCHTDKPLEDFSPSRRKNNAGSWCRVCLREYNRAYRDKHRERDREKVRLRNKRLNEENREKYRATRDQWVVDNREKMLAYYRDRGMEFRAWTDSIKADRPCLDCGGEFPPYLMDFDHVRGVKRYSIGNMANHKRERVLEEIAKCELVCRICHRIRTHSRVSPSKTPRRAAFKVWLDQLKSAPCVDCSESFPPEAMDYDHLDHTEKLKGITQMWSWSRDRVLVEIAKCELVCANCHGERTMQRDRYLLIHRPSEDKAA